jgi:hypothetical protein
MITDDQIRALMDEAGQAGDMTMAGVCLRALTGDTAARRRCEQVIQGRPAAENPRADSDLAWIEANGVEIGAIIKHLHTGNDTIRLRHPATGITVEHTSPNQLRSLHMAVLGMRTQLKAAGYDAASSGQKLTPDEIAGQPPAWQAGYSHGGQCC